SNNLPRDLILRCRKLLEIYELSATPGLINEDHLEQAIDADLGKDEPHIDIRPADAAASAEMATLQKLPDVEENVTQYGLYIDARKRVWRDGRLLQVQPSATEFRLLSYLCDHRYEICSHEDILEAVWSQGGDTSMLNTTLRRLRKVVEYEPARPSFIVRHVGRGIQLTDGLPGVHELEPQ
ncbi:MAG TPA: winged helix-turn-helix domain-containing protein, partial [Chloroflexia bacterium]